MTAIQKYILDALNQSAADKILIDFVIELKNRGWSQHAVAQIFNRFLVDKGNSLSQQQDVLLRDVLDRITGWCSPESRIWKETIENPSRAENTNPP